MTIKIISLLSVTNDCSIFVQFRIIHFILFLKDTVMKFKLNLTNFKCNHSTSWLLITAYTESRKLKSVKWDIDNNGFVWNFAWKQLIQRIIHNNLSFYCGCYPWICEHKSRNRTLWLQCAHYQHWLVFALCTDIERSYTKSVKWCQPCKGVNFFHCRYWPHIKG